MTAASAATTDPTPDDPRTQVMGRAVRLARFRTRPFVLGSLGWIVFFVYPLVPGFLARQIFDELAAHGATAAVYWRAVTIVATEVAVALILRRSHRTYAAAYQASIALAQANVLDAQLASGGPTAGPRTVAPGEAVSRFRDDTHDILIYMDNLVDVVGGVLFGGVAIAVLASIDAVATFVAVVPLALVSVLNRTLSDRLKRARRDARTAAADVSGYLGAVTGAALTVKVAGARIPVLARLDSLNERRGRLAVTDQILGDLAFMATDAVVNLCMGLALTITVLRSRSGQLDAGEVALFATYYANLAWLPRRIGWALVGQRRLQVAAARLDAMLPPDPPAGTDPLTDSRVLPILGGADFSLPPERARIPLARLELRGITVASRGLVGVDLSLERGTLTIVTGPVGAGKSTLLAALLGLVELDAGEVLWNGTPVTDRAAFFVPPQCAYVPQVPKLFADSLADNLLLGRAFPPEVLGDALRLAAFEQDVAGFADGLATLIGSGGVRLSGGQAQRAAAARALVRRPELLVLDDLTSALDVETELALWDRLAAEHFTVLAVSNRPVALARADRVLRLEPRST